MIFRTAAAGPWAILIVLAGQGAIEEAQQPIVGGRAAAELQWPTAVSFGACDGVLIHPRLVATAAHCLIGGYPRAIVLGAEEERAARTVPIEHCVRHPDYGRIEGADVGFCTLAEEVADLPIVPLLSTCEAAKYLGAGAAAVLVGFGRVGAEQGGGHVKRWVAVPIRGLRAGGSEVIVGSRDRGACDGDSGGPVYLPLPDGAWRVLGIVSRRGPSPDDQPAAPCASTTVCTSLPAYVAWIEDAAAVHIQRSGTCPMP